MSQSVESTPVLRNTGKKETTRICITEVQPMVTVAGSVTPTADSRQDERFSESLDGISMTREQRAAESDDEEDYVHLSPRLDPSYEDEDWVVSLPTGLPPPFGSDVSGSSVEVGDSPNSSSKEFRRLQSCPSIPQPSQDSRQREKRTLCRSLAWSQDSIEERSNTFLARDSKRSRQEESSSSTEIHDTRFSFYGFCGYGQRPVTTTNMVHWEQKVLDPMDLNIMLEGVIRLGSS